MAGAAHLLAMDCCNPGEPCQGHGYPGGGPGSGSGAGGGGHGGQQGGGAGNYPGGYPGYNPLQDLQAFSYSHYPEYHSPYQSCSLGGGGGGGNCGGNCGGSCGGGGGGAPSSQLEQFNNSYSYGNGFGNGYGGGYSSDYVYNPKEARLRKAMRDQVRCRTQGARTPGASGTGSAGTGSSGSSGAGRPQQQHHGAPQSPHSPAPSLQVKKKIMLSPRRMSEHQQQHQQRMNHSAVREQVEAGMLYDDAFVDLGYPHSHQHQQQQELQSMQGWYPMQHMQAADSGSPMRQWSNADCLVPSPHASPFGGMHNGQHNGPHNGQHNGRMPLLNGGGGGPSPGEVDDELKMKIEPGLSGSEDCQAFAMFANGKDPSSSNDRPDSLGLEDGALDAGLDGGLDAGLDSALAPTPGPTRLPGFQETFCSNEAGVSRGFDGFYSSAALELQVQTPPHPSAPLLGPLGPSDWPPLLFLPPGSELQHYPPGYPTGYQTGYQAGYPDRTLYPPAPCSPPYSPFGFCDYSVLDMMPLGRPVPPMPVPVPPQGCTQAYAQACTPPSCPSTPSAYTELTELHPYMHHMQFSRTPLGLGAAPADLADMEALIKQEELTGTEMEHQATLRRMVCTEPVIIQENERICVVRESGPARTFTAM